MVDNPVGRRVVQISVALGIVDVIAVGLRMLARWRSKAAFGADDALIIASLIPSSGMIVISYLSAEAGGMGLPTAVIFELGNEPAQMSTFLKLLMSSIVTYTLTISLVKISILVLYHRIFSTVVFRRSIPIVGAAVMLWFTVALFTDIFQCRPFKAAFDPELLYTDHCINLEAYYRGITLSNLGIDIAIMYMPLYVVWGLKLRRRQKVALSGIFLLGGVACVAGAMRFVTAGKLRKDDLTSSIADQYVWSQVEPALGILCACLMTLRPLFADLSLILSNISTRFRRNKSPLLPEANSLTNLIDKERVPHLQRPQISRSRHSERQRFSDQDPYLKQDLHIITVDLGTTDRKEPYVQLSDLGTETIGKRRSSKALS